MDNSNETKPVSDLPPTTGSDKKSDKKTKKSQKGASDNGHPLEV